MAITPVSSTNSSASAYGLDFQSLLQIILSQLTYQDPLKPMDNFQFVSQLAQFSQLQQSQVLNDNMQTLLSAQAASQATSLLGRTVDYLPQGATSAALSASGVVQAISFAGSSPTLTVKAADGTIISNVSLSQVSQVR